eukprot:8624663-Pyramimonas_sp.AAC.1
MQLVASPPKAKVNAKASGLLKDGRPEIQTPEQVLDHGAALPPKKLLQSPALVEPGSRAAA